MLFSVIIPTYNREKLIIPTINSVLAQAYPNFEIIIVDDGSTDNTEQVVTELNNKKILYFKKENEERAIARNFGILKAKGEYICFLDSDDILMPNHLSVALKIINDSKSIECFHLAYKITNTNGKLIKVVNNLSNNNTEIFKGNSLSCNGVFLRKDIALTNLFNKSLYASEDYELWIRLSAAFSFKKYKTVTSIIIEHENRSVLENNKEALINKQKVFLESILANQTLAKFISGNENKLKSNSFSYIALHLALTGKHKKISFFYLLQSFKNNFRMILSKRFLVIIKYLILCY